MFRICVVLCYITRVMLYNEVGANSRLTAYSNKYGMSCNVK